MIYDICIGDKVVGRYELTNMPGCAKIGISHGLVIHPEHRGKGYATKAHAERLEQAKKLGYRYLMATIVEGNKPQMHLLRKFKWREHGTLFNEKTDHVVTLWIKDLCDPYAELYE